MTVIKGKTADGKPLFGVVHSRQYRTFSDRPLFPWLLEIDIAMNVTTPDGLAAGQELATLSRFEYSLVTALARVTTIHPIGHITADGVREVYCYLAEPEVVHAFLSELARHEQVREFQYQIDEDPAWEFADELGV